MMAQDKFYNSKGWKLKRRYILQRDRNLCQRCLQAGRLTTAKLVHHVKPLEEHPDLAMDDKNLISLCVPCHEQTHSRAFGHKQKKEKTVPKGVRVIRF